MGFLLFLHLNILSSMLNVINCTFSNRVSVCKKWLYLSLFGQFVCEFGVCECLLGILGQIP